MKLYSENNEFKLYHGSMLDMLEVIEPKTIDSVVTDPPYELNFMGKGWDNSGIAFQKTTWEKCYQVLKPGGYLLAFGGTRTYHRIACAIEDAGFEIRDTIMWLYGSGFPKSLNLGKAIESKVINGSANTQDFRKLKGEMVATGDWGMGKLTLEQGYRPANYWEDQHLRVDKVDYQSTEGKQWDGWGTALKPAYEPIIVARKPCEGSCVDNVINYGVGGINIDECRIGTTEIKTQGGNKFTNLYGNFNECEESTHNGRFPANVILTYDETDQEEVCGGMPETSSTEAVGIRRSTRNAEIVFNNNSCGLNNEKYDPDKVEGFNDSGSAARYFYCAKASKRDRDEGLEAFSTQKTGDLQGGRQEGSAGSMMLNADGTLRVNPYAGGGAPKKNTHPTVKPTDLMQYLVRLVTPKKGIVLDPFNGSGSTGKAVMYENKDRNAEYRYIGIELTDEYLPIAEARIKFASGDNAPISIPEKPMKGQVTFFDLLEQTE